MKKNYLKKIQKMNMIILIMEKILILKELNQLLLIIFILLLISFIISSSLQENIPRYFGFYKESYLYKILVFKKINQ